MKKSSAISLLVILFTGILFFSVSMITVSNDSFVKEKELDEDDTLEEAESSGKHYHILAYGGGDGLATSYPEDVSFSSSFILIENTIKGSAFTFSLNKTLYLDYCNLKLDC